MNTTDSLIRRTVDGKKYYVRLATMRGGNEFWTTEVVPPRYFKTKRETLEYVQRQMEQPNRVILGNIITHDMRKDEI